MKSKPYLVIFLTIQCIYIVVVVEEVGMIFSLVDVVCMLGAIQVPWQAINLHCFS